MMKKPQVNLKKYQLPKKGKGFLVKVILYTILLILIFLFLQRRLKHSKLKSIENIDSIQLNHLKIDTTGY